MIVASDWRDVLQSPDRRSVTVQAEEQGRESGNDR